MEQSRKEQICKDTLRKLLKNRESIIRRVTSYGEYVYDAFERMLTVSTWRTEQYDVAKVYVVIGKVSESAFCFIEGENPVTGERIADLGDGYHDTGEFYFSEECIDIGADLDYLDFTEIEAAWEILYNKVLPQAIKMEIIYDFDLPYKEYEGDLQRDGKPEPVSAITVYWEP